MVQLKVNGMSCDHCVDAVNRAVRAVPGVTEVAVDLPAGTVRVEGSPDPVAVEAAIEKEGYEVG